MNQFTGARKKLTIGSIDDNDLQVTAQYNPKELQIDKPVPWAKHDVLGNRTARAAKADAIASRGHMHLEFAGSESRTMSVDLMFDGFETNESIMPQLEIIEQMASVQDATSSDEDLRRPHRCVVSWGDRGMRPFRCVIEGVSTKFLVFDTNGVPLRAVCTVKLKEADIVQTSAAEKDQYSGQKARR
jgi:hypothetical protein